eukprot:scaffold49887_cov33-Tisochrysis_lutea.AAC.5
MHTVTISCVLPLHHGPIEPLDVVLHVTAICKGAQFECMRKAQSILMGSALCPQHMRLEQKPRFIALSAHRCRIASRKARALPAEHWSSLGMNDASWRHVDLLRPSLRQQVAAAAGTQADLSPSLCVRLPMRWPGERAEPVDAKLR